MELFPAAIPVTCDTKSCEGWGRWRPTFLIYVEYRRDPLTAEMEMVICDTCLKRLGTRDFITDENWATIRDALVMKGYPMPLRERTLLDWELVEQ